jgi:hypothetical protein
VYNSEINLALLIVCSVLEPAVEHGRETGSVDLFYSIWSEHACQNRSGGARAGRTSVDAATGEGVADNQDLLENVSISGSTSLSLGRGSRASSDKC